MRRTKLRNFLIPSVVFHLVLIAFIVIYFVESGGGKGSGTIIVGIVSGEGTEQKGRAAGKPEHVPAASLNNSEDKTVEKKADAPPAQVRKKKPATETKMSVPAVSEETKKTAATKSNAGAGKQATREANPASGKRSGIDTAMLGADHDTHGSSPNPALGSGVTKSAYPDYKINPKPEYPTSARRRGYEGEVKLRVLVLEDGRVGKIEVEKPSGHQALDNSALKAVRDWIFIPGRENGREVSSWVTVPVSFRLDNG